MEIIYNKESLLYKGNDVENSSRLKGIHKVGKLVEPNFNERELISLVHPDKYIRKINQTCKYKQSGEYEFPFVN